MPIDSDPRRSASHANLIAHLSGPFRGGAIDTAVPIAAIAGGFGATVAEGARWPLILVATRAPVGPRGFDVTITVTPRAVPPAVPAPITAVLRVAPFTEAGACLPAWQARTEVAPGIDCTIAIAGVPAGAGTPADLLELRVVEGVLGRLLFTLGAEKARVRRQARELAALRRLEVAITGDGDPDHRRFGGALDRLGAELGVPRFTDRMQWDAAAKQVVSAIEREPDASYRRRLAMMRRFLMPTRSRVEAALQGFVGGGARFAINEANSDLAVAMLLRPSPDGAPRTELLEHLRAFRLVEPGKPIPAARPLPSAIRAAQQRVLDRIGGAGGNTSQASFELPATAFMAPLLAAALDRIGRCRRALGVTRRWKLLRAQDDAGGSRYELGLGVDVEAVPAAELDTLAQRLTARQFTAGTDPETLALLESLAPKSAAADPVGRWLLAGAGLRTMHPIAGGRWYLSHFPIYGTTLTDAGGVLEARQHAPGDPGPNAALSFGLADVTRDLTAGALPPLAQLTAAAAATAIAAAAVPSATALAAFTAAGLRTPEDAAGLARVKAELAAFPAEQLATLSLQAAHATGVLANTGAAVAQLARMVEIFGDRELVSVLPLVSGTQVLLVVGAATLPGAARVSSPHLGFRWYVLPIRGLAGALETDAGARNRYTAPAAAAGPSLSAVVAVSMARRDRDDPRDVISPYQVRVQMPPGQLLDLAGYERLMNLLVRAVPVGVVVDTSPVRERHVAPAGDATAVRFTGGLAHTFRMYEQVRRGGGATDDREP